MPRRIFLVTIAFAVGIPALGQGATAPEGPKLEVTASTGYFEIFNSTNTCLVGPTRTGSCSGRFQLYSSNNPPEDYPEPQCKTSTVFPVGSGWETWSGTGSCEITNRDRTGPEAADPTATLSRGSVACSTFSINYGGSDSDIYFWIIPNIPGGNTGQRVRVGPMTGWGFPNGLWTDVGPVPVGSQDVYSRLFFRLEGPTERSPTGQVYTLRLHFEGDAVASGSCSRGESYGFWSFSAVANGRFI